MSQLEKRVAELEAKLAARNIECDTLTVGRTVVMDGSGVTVLSLDNTPVASLTHSAADGSTKLALAPGYSGGPHMEMIATAERATVQLSGGATTEHAVVAAATAKNTAGVQVLEGKSTLWRAFTDSAGKVYAGTQSPR